MRELEYVSGMIVFGLVMVTTFIADLLGWPNGLWVLTIVPGITALAYFTELTQEERATLPPINYRSKWVIFGFLTVPCLLAPIILLTRG